MPTLFNFSTGNWEPIIDTIIAQLVIVHSIIIISVVIVDWIIKLLMNVFNFSCINEKMEKLWSLTLLNLFISALNLFVVQALLASMQ